MTSAFKGARSPDSEWSAIANERAETTTLFVGYVLPLAGAAAAAQLIGESVVGRSFGILGTYRLPLTTGLGLAIASLALAAVGAVLLSIVIDALAPTFGAEKNREQALKVAVYSATPVWLAGVLQIVPALGVVVLLYLGLPRLMKCPAEKAMGYTGAVIACAVVIAIVGGTLVGTISGVEATGLIPADLAQP